MKNPIRLALFLLLLSCNYEREITYYPNGNIKSIKTYSLNKEKDSLINYYKDVANAISSIQYWKQNNPYYQNFFFKNGKLKSEGPLLKNNFRSGKWTFYSSDNYKSEIVEFLDIRNKPYKNQVWKLNQNGDTISGGNFYKVKMDKKIIVNNASRVHFFLQQRTLLNSEAFICILKDGNTIEPDFKSELNPKWDTIYSVSRLSKKYPDRKYDIIFDLEPTNTGKKQLTGFIVEKQDLKNRDSVGFVTRKIYFNIPYTVIEDI